jgi:hypothetical protein
MTTPVPERELAFNYNFLTSPLGAFAFTFLLESRAAIQLFSNAFLFANKCDETWISNCLDEACAAVRPPVQVFNAGFCLSRSYRHEFERMIWPKIPVLILQGDQDVRRRQDYCLDSMGGGCSVQTIPGSKNVLPWESPLATVMAIRAFCGYCNYLNASSSS